MNAIYEPKGAAREYAPFALNLYAECSHGCTYCYAPAVLRKTRDQFACVSPRGGILDALKTDLKKSVPKETVLLSFTSDPYQPAELKHRMTRQALEIMDGIVPKVAILTKNTNVREDFDIIARNGWTVGTTLSCATDATAAKYEPCAPTPNERIEMLKDAEKLGIKTFVSMEPIISVEEMPAVFSKLGKMTLANGVRIGKWNHSAEASKTIDWNLVLKLALNFAETVPYPVYIKDELAKYGDVPTKFRRSIFG